MARLALSAVLLAAGSAAADDLTGARNLLCSVVEVHVCRQAEGCGQVLPEDLNLPRFIHVDTRTGKLATTAASGENRETTAATVTRDAGQIILQGVEQGRAFSIFIHESTGLATFAAAAEGRSVSVFAACTPSTGN
jgi:hypothetical protein